MALGVSLMAPAHARGQIILPQQQCVGAFTACATLLSINFSGSTLTLVISNTSAAAQNPDSYVRRLFLEFNGAVLPNATSATVFYSDDQQETWNITQPPRGRPGGFGHTWDLSITDPSTGGNDLRGPSPGDMFTVVIEFAEDFEGLALFDCGSDCRGRGWSAQMQALGPEDGSGYTAIPEPVTMVLVGTGLAGVGLMRRRRRRGLDIVTD